MLFRSDKTFFLLFNKQYQIAQADGKIDHAMVGDKFDLRVTTIQQFGGRASLLLKEADYLLVSLGQSKQVAEKLGLDVPALRKFRDQHANSVNALKQEKASQLIELNQQQFLFSIKPERHALLEELRQLLKFYIVDMNWLMASCYLRTEQDPFWWMWLFLEEALK